MRRSGALQALRPWIAAFALQRTWVVDMPLSYSAAAARFGNTQFGRTKWQV